MAEKLSKLKPVGYRGGEGNDGSSSNWACIQAGNNGDSGGNHAIGPRRLGDSGDLDRNRAGGVLGDGDARTFGGMVEEKTQGWAGPVIKRTHQRGSSSNDKQSGISTGIRIPTFTKVDKENSVGDFDKSDGKLESPSQVDNSGKEKEMAKTPTDKTCVQRTKLSLKHNISPKIEQLTKSLKTKRGRTLQRNYTLNEVSALKKKLDCETDRRSNFYMGNEASNGANIQVMMKTSFFEYTKAKFIEDIQASGVVTSVENATRVKVGTETQGEAFVEYAVTISFMVHSIEHTIKLTAYATTCKIMVQSIGEKPEPKAVFNNKCLPRFFVETILLLWCELSCKNGFNNNYSELTINKLKSDIEKIETSKDTK